MKRKPNALYKTNIMIALKLLLDWTPSCILERKISQKLKEIKAKRGNQRMTQHIVNFILEKELIDVLTDKPKFLYTKEDIPELTEAFLLWDYETYIKPKQTEASHTS